MARSRKKICKLCQTKLIGKDLEKTGDRIKKILDVLLLQMSFNSKSPLICNTCIKQLMAAFEFKSTCLYTEDIIFPYTDGAETTQLNLEEIYMEGNKNLNPKEVLGDKKICRLCMKVVKDDFKVISEMNPDLFAKFLPEVNLTIIKDPVICNECSDHFSIHTAFLREFLGVVKENKASQEACIKTEGFIVKTEHIVVKTTEDIVDENEGIVEKTEDFPIKTEEIEIKTEEIEIGSPEETDDKGAIAVLKPTTGKSLIKRNQYRKSGIERKQTKYLYHIIKEESSSAERLYQCILCSFISKYKCSIYRHQSMHQTIPCKIYKCDKCDYSSNRKDRLVRHQNLHKETSKMQKYKCNKCNFEAKANYELKRHQVLHTAEYTYSCDTCSYKAKQKHYLVRHMLSHKDSSEVRLFKCYECEFETKHRESLIRHRKHHTSTGLPYKCDGCTYRTRYKQHLNRHQRRHFSVSHSSGGSQCRSLPLFKCEHCEYRTNLKRSLQVHQAVHKDVSEVQMYKCHSCSYQSHRKSYLQAHQLVHREPGKVRMYKCAICPFQSKYKSRWKYHHEVRHGMGQTYTCNSCAFTTKNVAQLKSHLLTHKDPSEGRSTNVCCNASSCCSSYDRSHGSCLVADVPGI